MRVGVLRREWAAAVLIAAALSGCDESAAPAPTSPAVPAPAPPPPPVRCAAEDRVLDYGFYAFYEPISYAGSPDPAAEGFHEHLGYEADLLTALEAMGGAGLAFRRRGIAEFPGIWLLPATPEFDLIGGGVSIVEERTRDAAGAPTVAFTSGHIEFRHSLLVRAADAFRLSAYRDLTSEHRVGVLAETTGESRFLRLVGLSDADGVLVAGARVTTPDGVVVADGSDAFRIAPAGSSANLAGRTRLEPPSDEFPEVELFPVETPRQELLLALVTGYLDALAGTEIENRVTMEASGGRLVVGPLDAQFELGGFVLDAEEATLLACLDDKLNYLTDERAIGFADWLANPSVFLERAEAWTP